MDKCELFLPQSGDNFKLLFAKLPISDDLEGGKDLSLSIYNTIIPGLGFSSEELGWQGYRDKAIFGKLGYDPMITSFMIDGEFKNWKILYKWLNIINNNKDISGKSFDKYIVDSSLVIYGNYGKKVLTLKFSNMYVESLSSVRLNQRDGNDYLECDATFLYSYMEII